MGKADVRVAITGMGVISPVGNSTEATWNALLDGQSGIDDIKHFDASHFPTKIASEIKNFQLTSTVAPKLVKQAGRYMQYALNAAEEAFVDAGIRPTASTASRWGAVVGAGMMASEFEDLSLFQKLCAKDGKPNWQALAAEVERYYNLPDFARMTVNCGLSLLLQQHQIQGYCNEVHTACASGGQAMGLAMQALKRGDADYMLAGGFDSMINPVGLSSFCLLGALSTDNETPTSASRPFDYKRNGFVLGEGAAFVILESFEHAKRRGARIYAELKGEGNSLSAYRITDSPADGDGAMQALRGALMSANVHCEDIGYINAHGTSTKMNDLSETNAIKAVFGEYAKSLAVSSTKSMTGHLIAAAGALECVVTALSLYHQKVPMTKNLTTPDPDCDLDYVTEGARALPLKAAMTNSFGFGGSNSALVLTHPEYEGRDYE